MTLRRLNKKTGKTTVTGVQSVDLEQARSSLPHTHVMPRWINLVLLLGIGLLLGEVASAPVEGSQQCQDPACVSCPNDTCVECIGGAMLLGDHCFALQLRGASPKVEEPMMYRMMSDITVETKLDTEDINLMGMIHYSWSIKAKTSEGETELPMTSSRPKFIIRKQSLRPGLYIISVNASGTLMFLPKIHGDYGGLHNESGSGNYSQISPGNYSSEGEGANEFANASYSGDPNGNNSAYGAPDGPQQVGHQELIPQDFLLTPHGYFEIVAAELEPKIGGGVQRAVIEGHPFRVDGRGSKDPNAIEGDVDTLTFHWFCINENETFPSSLHTEPSSAITESNSEVHASNDSLGNNSTSEGSDSNANDTVAEINDNPEVQEDNTGGCFGTGIALNYTTDSRFLSVGAEDFVPPVRVPASYTFALKISNGEKTAITYQNILVVDADTPITSFKCRMNCGSYYNPRLPIVIKLVCSNCVRNDDSVTYTWDLIDQSTEETISVDWAKISKSGNGKSDVYILPNTLSEITDSFALRGTVSKGEKSGFTYQQYAINTPPEGGTCIIDPDDGQLLADTFMVNCSDWSDDDEPITYSVFALKDGEKRMVKKSVSGEIEDIFLPMGNPKDDYRLTVQVLISDSAGMATAVSLSVHVREAVMDDAALQASNSEYLEQFKNSQDVGGMAQYIGAVASHLNKKKDDRESDPTQADAETKRAENIAMRKNLISNLKDQVGSVDSVDSFMQSAAAMEMVTDASDELDEDTQRDALNAMNSLAAAFRSRRTDGEMSKDEVEETGIQMLKTVAHLFKASKSVTPAPSVNGSASDEGTEETPEHRQQRLKNQRESLNVLKSVNKDMLQNKVPGEEATVFEMDNMQVKLQAFDKDDFDQGLSYEFDVDTNETSDSTSPRLRSKPKLNLPRNMVFGDGEAESIGVEVVMFNENPYEPNTTDDTGFIFIGTPVLEMVLMDENGTEIKPTNLSEKLALVMPRIESDGTALNKTVAAEPSEMAIYAMEKIGTGKFNLQLKLSLEKTVLLAELAKSGGSNRQIRVKIYQDRDASSFDGTTSSEGLVEDEVVRLGDFVDDESSPGRSKRHLLHRYSSLNAPRISNRTVLTMELGAGDSIDVDLALTQVGCVYWDEDVEEWDDSGCEIGENSTEDELHCECDHMTAFAGQVDDLDSDVTSAPVLQTTEAPESTAVPTFAPAATTPAPASTNAPTTATTGTTQRAVTQTSATTAQTTARTTAAATAASTTTAKALRSAGESGNSGGGSNKTGLIVVMVIGGVVLVGIMVGLCMYNKNKKNAVEPVEAPVVVTHKTDPRGDAPPTKGPSPFEKEPSAAGESRPASQPASQAASQGKGGSQPGSPSNAEQSQHGESTRNSRPTSNAPTEGGEAEGEAGSDQNADGEEAQEEGGDEAPKEDADDEEKND